MKEVDVAAKLSIIRYSPVEDPAPLSSSKDLEIIATTLQLRLSQTSMAFAAVNDPVAGAMPDIAPHAPEDAPKLAYKSYK